MLKTSFCWSLLYFTMFKDKKNYLAILLHSFAYKGSSMIGTLLIKELGITSAMIFASNKSYKIQPFNIVEVLIYRKKNEGLLKIYHVDQISRFDFQYRALGTMLRINALICQLLSKGEPYHALFEQYCWLMQNFTKENMILFKSLILTYLGYGIQCRVDATGSEIKKDLFYTFMPLAPFQLSSSGIPGTTILKFKDKIHAMDPEQLMQIHKIINLSLKAYYYQYGRGKWLLHHSNVAVMEGATLS